MAPAKRDYYKVLGVDRDADDVELKRAFREMARKFHPDVNPGPNAEERFKEANEAYAVLSNPRARDGYNKYGFAGVDRTNMPAGGFGSVVDAFDDIIGDILRKRRQKKRGRDLRYTLELTFEEAALGCSKTIKVPDPAAKESEENKEFRTFSVACAAGTKDGAVKRIKGQGETGKGAGSSGDLSVIIRVREHAVFQREDFNVWCELPISFPQAAIGASVEVPTLEGNVRMRIPAGTQSGRVFRVRGRGIPKGGSGTGARGDQLVRVIVETPTELTARQRELLEAFASETGETLDDGNRSGFLDRVKSLF